ncbi:MAG: enoyl-CoA hydratase/isomerase family protein [Chloroflexi bacterium]|nr:enoyl-CoA hydratase/isomerase family protein [Chloroflexota bacterium]
MPVERDDYANIVFEPHRLNVKLGAPAAEEVVEEPKYDNILVEKKGRVVWITLNQPEKRNPLSWKTEGEIVYALEEANLDPEVRVVVVRGNGPAFSGGHDLTQIGLSADVRHDTRPSVRRLIEREVRHHTFYEYIFNYPKIIICQVHGFALHGGENFAMMCDITIVAEDSQFQGRGAPVVNIAGYLPLMGPPVGLGRRNLAFHISGKDAERMGMVSKALPLEELTDYVDKLAEAMSLLPSDAVELNKRALNGMLQNAGFEGAWMVSGLMHSSGRHQRIRPGEYSFSKSRRDLGVKATIEARRTEDLAYKGTKAGS